MRPQVFLMLTALALAPALGAQTCQVREEMPAAERSALESAAQQAFEQSSRGDIVALQAGAIASLRSNFNGIATAVTDRRPAFTGAIAQVRSAFLLNTGATPSVDGHYICGAFSASGPTAGSAEFNLPGLQAGRYGIVIHDFNGSQGNFALTTIFQDASGWKLAGLYVRAETANGHDGIWHLQRAREFKSKGQLHNAWFYYVTAWELLAPVTFIDTRLLSKITQESNAIQPKDVPAAGAAVTFNAGGKAYKLTEMTVFSTSGTYDLSIRYSVASAADLSASQAEARSLGAAYVALHPELKETFANIVVHAVDAAGGDAVGVVDLQQ
ncbi:MAG TPA: hypothetical protein VNW97_20390 [Candidatus Saccharimonadales bacterium]|jgi:hypothetical protein|nr:hypothetical protein [Candidatus Saccharimonadales bacterium]